MNTLRAVFQDFLWGIERETHRMQNDGTTSSQGHPASLRSPSFTKDFAESQLELVTRPWPSIAESLDELRDLTQTAYREIGDELLWPFSMPPRFAPTIATARMGSGDAARIAERYRNGLSARYGIARQMICGVHVNVSFGERLLDYLRAASPLMPEEASGGSDRDGYSLRLVRNLFGDMPYFAMAFGVSPFHEGDSAPGALSRPVFSYRNSPLGYARTEYRPYLDLTSVSAHIAGIRKGLRTESAAFRKLGLVRDGSPIQLNDRVFQREKEFYAPIRFRRVARGGETPLRALERRGVEYLELRFFDVDPFSPIGVSEDALRLAHLFILDALSRPSLPQDGADLSRVLLRADSAALGNPLERAPLDFAPTIRERLASLESFAAALGAEYEATLGEYKREARTRGESRAGRLSRDVIASGLSWTDYGMRLARGLRDAATGTGGSRRAETETAEADDSREAILSPTPFDKAESTGRIDPIDMIGPTRQIAKAENF